LLIVGCFEAHNLFEALSLLSSSGIHIVDCAWLIRYLALCMHQYIRGSRKDSSNRRCFQLSSGGGPVSEYFDRYKNGSLETTIERRLTLDTH